MIIKLLLFYTRLFALGINRTLFTFTLLTIDFVDVDLYLSHDYIYITIFILMVSNKHFTFLLRYYFTLFVI